MNDFSLPFLSAGDSSPFMVAPLRDYWAATGARLDNPEKHSGAIEGIDRHGQYLARLSPGKLLQAMPCFTADCRIDTARGLVPVSALRPGDLVTTRDHGQRTVLWVGTCHFDWRLLGLFPILRAISIEAGALGPGLPVRTCRMSPNHGLLVDPAAGALTLAADLIGRAGVSQSCEQSVTYFPILLDCHALVRANGLWCESFVPSNAAVAALPDSEAKALSAALSDLAPFKRHYPHAAHLTYACQD